MASRRSNEHFEGSFFSRAISAVMYPFRAFAADAFSGRSSMRAERSFGQQLLHWVTAPFRFLAGFAVFLVQAWASSRSGWTFLLGLPAVLAIAVFLSGLWLIGIKQNRIYGVMNAGFEQAGKMMSVDSSKAKRARMHRTKFAHSMVGMRPDSEADKHRFGLAAASDQKLPQALDVMRMLAPDDAAGLSDAHLWRAAYFQNERWFAAEEEERDRLVLKHLDMAIQQSPDNKEAHEKLSEIQIRRAYTFDDESPEQRKYLTEALEHSAAMLEGGVQSVPDLLAVVRVVRLQKELYGVEAARKQFERLETNTLQPLVQRAPNVFEVWMVLVSCALELEDFQLAQRFIGDGFHTSDSQEVRKKIAALSSSVLLREAELADDMTSLKEYQTRLFALTRAFNLNPTNTKTYQGLVKFIASDAGDNFNMEWFEEARVASPDPGILSTMLGLRAVIDGDQKVARTHWRVSQQLFTLSEIVLNHLIMVGSKSAAEEFQDPVDLLTKSLISFPDSPILLQSRGYLFAKDKQYEQAISDFEIALDKLPDLREARQYLILIHTELGNSSEVARHQGLLKDTLNKITIEERDPITKRLKSLTL